MSFNESLKFHTNSVPPDLSIMNILDVFLGFFNKATFEEQKSPTRFSFISGFINLCFL